MRSISGSNCDATKRVTVTVNTVGANIAKKLEISKRNKLFRCKIISGYTF